MHVVFYMYVYWFPCIYCRGGFRALNVRMSSINLFIWTAIMEDIN